MDSDSAKRFIASVVIILSSYGRIIITVNSSIQ